MVLGASRHLKMPQEWLDQLSLTAVELLNGDMGFAGIEHMQTAILVQGERVSLFLRAADHPSEALCCDCTADIHLVNFGRAAEQALKVMGSLP